MKARIVWSLAALALLAAVGWRIASARSAAAHVEQRPAETLLIQTARVSRGPMTEQLELTGTIRAAHEVDVFSKVGGRIAKTHVQVGDLVKAGATLATIEHREIALQAKAAQAQLEVAKAGLAGAQVTFDRTEALVKVGSAPQVQLDGAKTQLALARAQATAAEAAAALAQQQVENARVESPISGTVTKKSAQVGAMVGPQAPLFTVQQLAQLKLDSSVDPTGFARLQKGQDCVVSVDALPTERFPCTLSVLSPSLDATTRRAAIELALENSGGRLLPHMFARAVITIGHQKDALLAPRPAVLETPKGPVVFRVTGDTVEEVRLTLGARDVSHVQVLSGLAEGDEVAISHVGDLTPGISVKKAAQPSEGR
ncbi:MAG: efflux RND transporter periplasmic adaptor subunit [Myxococcota bacterium]